MDQMVGVRPIVAEEQAGLYGAGWLEIAVAAAGRSVRQRFWSALSSASRLGSLPRATCSGVKGRVSGSALHRPPRKSVALPARSMLGLHASGNRCLGGRDVLARWLAARVSMRVEGAS